MKQNTKITKEELFIKSVPTESSHIGTATKGNIDKGAVFYHVITVSWRKRRLFDRDLARYRQELLCELCAKKGVSILFSVTMPTHTHEVFITPDWETLSCVVKLVNANVAKMAHDRYKDGRRVFSGDPEYIAINSMDHLFFLGKYTFGNQQYLKNDGKPVPDSCFWMFEKNYFVEPYNGDLYVKLFGMEPSKLLEIYSTKTDAEVRALARQLFGDWTELDNESLFRNDHHLPPDCKALQGE